MLHIHYTAREAGHLNRNHLALAPTTVAVTGHADTGWQLTVDNTNVAVFAFLKKHRAERVYLTISYAIDN